MVDVIKNELEGVVRKEAVSVVICIYENQKVQPNQLNAIYEALSNAAIHDLFWEVKVKAIEFWHCVIKRQFQYQGVIDGCFPSVTFSKEYKKIVTLTQKEITLRLTKVLVQLSSFGCLGVLLASLDDRDDVLVVKKSVEVINSLTEFLDKYNYWEEMRENFQSTAASAAATTSRTSIDVGSSSAIGGRKSTNNIEDMENRPKEKRVKSNTDMETDDAMLNSDDVIQSIVSAQDINLLTKAYENQMSVNANATSNQETINNEEHFKRFCDVTPQAFLDKIKSTNLCELLKARTEWLAQTESFSSLLNDMSYSLQAHELHDADCY